MELLLSLLSSAIYASEVIISPLPDKFSLSNNIILNGDVKSFGSILSPTPTPFEEFSIRESNQAKPTSSPTPSPSVTPTNVNQYETKALNTNLKGNYTIALVGDSMIDTLGQNLETLQNQLKSVYPSAKFNLLNYGKGGTQIEDGMTRIDNNYEYLDRRLPSIKDSNPNLIIIESFAYNPKPNDLDLTTNHWINLGKFVEKVRSNLPNTKILLAATIAPNSQVFGDGAAGLSFDSTAKKEHTDRIKSLLVNTIKYSESTKIPLADAYTPSLTKNGDGKLDLINGGDHIHYSDNGRSFFTNIIVKSIYTNKLLE